MVKVRFILLLLLSALQVNLFGQYSTRVMDLLEAGKNEWAANNYVAALQMFDEVIEQEPTYAEAYFYRASTKSQIGDYHGGLMDYTVYLNMEPENSEALFAYSALCYKLKKYKQAKEGFLSVLKLPTGSTNRIYFAIPESGTGATRIFTTQSNTKDLIYNYLGLCEKELGNYTEALSYFNQALEIAPDKPDYLVNRGLLYQQAEQPALAMKDFRKALAISPDHSLAQYSLGVMLSESGNKLEASEYYDAAIKENPDSPYAFRRRGFSKMEAGDNEGALADLTRAILLDGGEATTLLNRGIVYDRLKEPEKAIRDFSEVIRLTPNNAGAYLNRGNVLFKLQEYEDALNDYEVALFYDHEYGLAYYHRGVTHYRLGNSDSACSDLQRAIDLNVEPAQNAYDRICYSLSEQ